MTNKYLVQLMSAPELELYADVMAHTDAEALELGRKYLNDNHNLYLNLADLEIANVERSFDGQHDVRLHTDYEGNWVTLHIDDELVMEGHSITGKEMLEMLADALGDELVVTITSNEDEEDAER